MPKNTAECGKRDERELVKDLTVRGYRARRQPGSGNVDPTLPHDVVWEDSPIGKLLIECKWRASCGWKTLLTWMEGAPILTLGCDRRRQQDSERYVFMRWDTFMALVGDAAQRAEAADLGAQIATPDKPYLTEAERDSLIVEDAAVREMARDAAGLAVVRQAIAERQQRIQDFHQNPPKRPMKPRRLGR